MGKLCSGEDHVAGLARIEGRLALEETLARFPTWSVDEAGVELVHTSTGAGPRPGAVLGGVATRVLRP